MNVVDSSAWLEFFRGGANGAYFKPAIMDIPRLTVPTVVIYEVFKKLLTELDEKSAQLFTAQMYQGTVVDLDARLAVRAVRVSQTYRLSLADAVIYATAQEMSATLWSQDRHFEGLPNVKFKTKSEVQKRKG